MPTNILKLLTNREDHNGSTEWYVVLHLLGQSLVADIIGAGFIGIVVDGVVLLPRHSTLPMNMNVRTQIPPLILTP